MRYPNAASGLRLLFLGQILAIVGILLAWVPMVGILLILASPVLEAVGLYKAGDDDEAYRGALVFAVLCLAVDLLGGILSGGFLTGLLEIAASVLNLLLMFSVCNTTSNLLHSVGEEELSRQGQTVIKIYAACTVVSIVCRVLSIVPIINIAAVLASAAAAIVQLVGYVMYLLFLNGSSKSL